MALKSKVNEAELKALYRALGFGMLNYGFAVEASAKQSFLSSPPSVPGGPPAVRTGNLRRSIHTAAYVFGEQIGSSSADVPPYGAGRDEIVVFVGTNVGYGLFVELGTIYMAARPFLVPAHMAHQGDVLGLIAAGAKAHYSRGGRG